MKHYQASVFFIILALLLLSSPYPALADQLWHYQASSQVEKPGLIEAVLPAGVFFGTDSASKTSQLDLTLVGGRRERANPVNIRSSKKRNMLTDKCPLAVTIQTLNYAFVYGNRPGSSGACHA